MLLNNTLKKLKAYSKQFGYFLNKLETYSYKNITFRIHSYFLVHTSEETISKTKNSLPDLKLEFTHARNISCLDKIF